MAKSSQIEVHFYLHTPKKKSSPIYLRFFYDGRRVIISTGLSIEVRHWNANKNRPKHQIAQYDEFKRALDRIEPVVNDFYWQKRGEGLIPAESEFKEYLKAVLRNKEKEEEKHLNFFDAYTEYIELHERNKLGAKNSIKHYKSLAAVLTDFQKNSNWEVSFNTIDKRFEDEFRYYLTHQRENARIGKYSKEKGLLNATVAKHFLHLKRFMRWAKERGYHATTEYEAFDSSRKNDRPKKLGKNDIVVLTEDEFKLLEEFDFSKNQRLERVRDLFLFATYTAQRWSDVDGFKKEDVKDNVWGFVSDKTKEWIRVPFIGWCGKALTILKKYDWELPKMTEQSFNRNIKEVCKQVGIDTRTVLHRNSGKETLVYEFEKYKEISSHCARRTAITLLGTRGIPLNVLQLLTGHEDVETLMRYINTPSTALDEWLEKLA